MNNLSLSKINDCLFVFVFKKDILADAESSRSQKKSAFITSSEVLTTTEGKSRGHTDSSGRSDVSWRCGSMKPHSPFDRTDGWWEEKHLKQ